MGGIFAALLLFVVLYQHYSFSQPALELAKFIEDLPEQERINQPRTSKKWKYWFNSAAKTEMDRRQHLETISHHNQELEQRVEERTIALKEALDALKAAQDELIQSEKMAGLGSLVAGIAHELNTPIGNALLVSSTIKSLNDDFKEDIEQGLTQRLLDEYLDHSSESADSIERNLKRAAELIKSFKQVAVDQSSYQRRSFDLPEILHELRVTMSPTLKKHQIELIESDTPPVGMDSFPGPLTQVLMNLLSNTVTHAFSNQTERKVTITASAVSENMARIELEDNGDGIESHNLSKIFDPFYTTRLGQGGSGLGLSIVFNIVTGILGGEITVNSEKGVGTRFTITIPLTAPE